MIDLLDDTTVKGKLINYHTHYNIAIFEVIVNVSTEIPVSTEEVKYGQEVFIVGRDENLNLNARHGRVECEDPGLFDHHHFMYVDCGVFKVTIYMCVIFLLHLINFLDFLKYIRNHSFLTTDSKSHVVKNLLVWRRWTRH